MNVRRTLLSLICCSLMGASGAYAADAVKTADVIIIGAGASGTAATMAAAEKGASVILLEKQPSVGGTGNFAEGIFAAESSMQKRQGIIVTRDMAFKTIMDYSHWLANPFVARAFVDRSADTIEWVKSKGITFEYIGPGGPLTWHVIEGEGHGRHLIKTFHDQFKQMPVTTLLETTAKELIVENGKVVGVRAENADGDKIEAKGKAVIIATGGYANNKEMLKQYTPFPDVIMVGNVGKMGEGIKMAWAAGAAEEGIGVIQAYRPGLPGYSTSSHLLAAARQPYLWVDQHGRRFTDESIVILWPYSGNALMKIGGTMFSIYDENSRQHFINNGIDVPIGEWVIAGTKLEKLDDEFQKEAGRNRGYVFKGNTIEELAKAMGVDAAVLKETIAQNNQFASQRRDDIFAKNFEYLRPVEQGPFYATKMLPAALGTLGGVKINGQMEAVNADGEKIPGLYVVGNDAGGMYGDTYDLLLGGGTFGFALNSGRIAAENALDYMQFKKQ